MMPNYFLRTTKGIVFLIVIILGFTQLFLFSSPVSAYTAPTGLLAGTVNVSVVSGVNYQLSVSKLGTGSGTVTSSDGGINCGSDCTEEYANGTSVTLTATASSGSSFAGLGGNCTGTSPTCPITMDSNKTVTATFNAAAGGGEAPGGGGGGGGAAAEGAPAASIDFSKADSFAKSGKAGQAFTMKIIQPIQRAEDGVLITDLDKMAYEIHSVNIESIVDGRAKIVLSSSPIILLISAGETKYVDFDNDGEYDLKIYCKSIAGDSVDLTFTSLRTLKLLAFPAKFDVPQSSNYIYSLSVQNFGVLPQNNVSISIRGISGEETLDIVPKIVEIIPRNKTSIFMVSLKVLPDAEIGKKELILRLSSGQIVSEYKAVLNVVENPLKPFLNVLDNDSLNREILNAQSAIGPLWEIAIKRQLQGEDMADLLAILKSANFELEKAKVDLNNGRLAAAASSIRSAKDNVESAVALINIPKHPSEKIIRYLIIAAAIFIVVAVLVHYSGEIGRRFAISKALKDLDEKLGSRRFAKTLKYKERIICLGGAL